MLERTQSSGEKVLRALQKTQIGNLALLWVAGASLRMTILAIPPVLPSIHHDLHLDEKLVGALSSLPLLLLAAAAVSGSLLVARLGARRALIFGLALTAAAGALRGLGAATPVLFAMTLLMGVGIALSQPTLPTLVRRWFSDRIGFATAVFSNGFLVGEVAAASLTVPLVLPLVGGRWELVLAIWSVPVVLTAAALLAFTSDRTGGEAIGNLRWWPDWRSSITWRLGLMFGCASIGYFGTNTFVPDYLRATHHAGLIAWALSSVNISQLPASFLILAAPGFFVARRWPIMLAGLLMLLAILAFKFGGAWVVAGAGVLGFATAGVFVLTLALPPLIAGEHDVHRLSAAMFTICYTCPFVAATAGGALWDATSIPFTAFIPLIAAGVLMSILASGLNVQSTRAETAPLAEALP